MKKAVVKLASASTYGQSRFYEVEKLEKESVADYEKRTWKNRCHVDDKGMVYIPAMAIKNCMSAAAKYLSLQIPGKGKKTYTKHIESGVMVLENVALNIPIDAVDGMWLFLPSDGRRGGTTRVKKCMPYIKSWQAEVTFLVLDETITEEVFAEILKEAGRFIGLGFFRPSNNGTWGRFEVQSIQWI